MQKRRVFIGCSTQGLEIAEAVQQHLRRDHDIAVWNQGLFGLGRSVFDGLIELVGAMDYAVFVMRGDDVQLRQHEREAVARANVLFELGMAIGRIGRLRTFIVYDTHSKPAVTSDLEGIIWTGYDGSATNNRFQCVAKACTEIRREIKKREGVERGQAGSPGGEVWYTEWQMGTNRYVERLRLTIEPEADSGGYPVSRVVGVREYDRVGGESQLFRVVGTASRGLYWLEYHRTDGIGGGTIFLRPSGGKMHGIISAGHCHESVMRAYSNGWVPQGHEKSYDPKWLETRAIFQPRLPEAVSGGQSTTSRKLPLARPSITGTKGRKARLRGATNGVKTVLWHLRSASLH